MSGDAQLAKWFRQVDRNNSGRLNHSELQQALRNNNYTTFDPSCVQGRSTIGKYMENMAQIYTGIILGFVLHLSGPSFLLLVEEK